MTLRRSPLRACTMMTGHSDEDREGARVAFLRRSRLCVWATIFGFKFDKFVRPWPLAPRLLLRLVVRLKLPHLQCAPPLRRIHRVRRRARPWHRRLITLEALHVMLVADGRLLRAHRSIPPYVGGEGRGRALLKGQLVAKEQEGWRIIRARSRGGDPILIISLIRLVATIHLITPWRRTRPVVRLTLTHIRRRGVTELILKSALTRAVPWRPPPNLGPLGLSSTARTRTPNR